MRWYDVLCLAKWAVVDGVLAQCSMGYCGDYCGD